MPERNAERTGRYSRYPRGLKGQKGRASRRWQKDSPPGPQTCKSESHEKHRVPLKQIFDAAQHDAECNKLSIARRFVQQAAPQCLCPCGEGAAPRRRTGPGHAVSQGFSPFSKVKSSIPDRYFPVRYCKRSGRGPTGNRQGPDWHPVRPRSGVSGHPPDR